MTNLPDYPLAQVIDIKKRRVDAAEKVVTEKKELLQKEKEKLKEAEKQRDKVKEHLNAKLLQLRDYLDTAGMKPSKVLQMKVYLKLVQEKLLGEEEKVKKQEENVKIAEKNLEDAKEDLRKKEHEVEKLNMHKEEWEKEALKEVLLKETQELDEIGSIMFLKKLRERQK